MTFVVSEVGVGSARIPLAEAVAWVHEYTHPSVGENAGKPYAYPAYDHYDHAHNDRDTISDADLLAPTLLNVAPTVRAFYGLQRIKGHLEEALSNKDLDRPLAQIDDPGRVEAMVKPLYAVLDTRHTRPVGVKGTTLSKVLHRKRPESIVLHDRWVEKCYASHLKGPARPGNRTWADYMAALSTTVGEDIRSQPEAFAQLRAASPGDLTDVRLLDILALRSQGQSPLHQGPLVQPAHDPTGV